MENILTYTQYRNFNVYTDIQLSSIIVTKFQNFAYMVQII